MPWSARFTDPIILPDGRELETLPDAAAYITGVPQAEHGAKEWQTAMQTATTSQPVSYQGYLQTDHWREGWI